jgi:hypothetical protein
MVPYSISASSLETANNCLAWYKASSMDKGGGFQNDAALLGTTLHLTLERYLEPIENGFKEWSWDTLKKLYIQAYSEIFKGGQQGDIYEDGLRIIEKWFNRPDMRSEILDAAILSREVKKNFPVPYYDGAGTLLGKIPLNYIIDRLDLTDDECYRIVDYKSQRAPLTPEQLFDKLQARIYALAIQIEHPNAREIMVQFDFLRYDRVAVVFTKADNILTWERLKAQLDRIISTPPDNPPETLNQSCRFCPRKLTCSALQRNLRVGGIFSLSMDELAERYLEMKSQLDAMKSAAEEVEVHLLQYARDNDMLEWDGPGYSVKVAGRRQRVIDRDRAALILGADLMKEYGRLNVSDLDTLRKDPRVTDAQASLLQTAVSYQYSDPSIKITRKSV